jgi:ABC-2 type transport system ATP-binding protein
VRVLGVDPRRDLDRVKQVIGVQLQATSYFSLLTLDELLTLLGSFYAKRRSPAELLATVGLAGQRRAYVRQLSGGQQRRFSVAAALVNDPEVISSTSRQPGSIRRCFTDCGISGGDSTTPRARRSC